MSFAADLKLELTKIKQDKCCDLAELYGLLNFSKRQKNNNIIFSTSHKCVVDRFAKLMLNCFNVNPNITLGGGKNNRYYNASVNSVNVKYSIEKKNKQTDIELLLKRECCTSAYFRGVFLSCGSMSNPNKDYHLEFVTLNMEHAEALCEQLRKQNVLPKISVRKNSVAVYFKNSDSIEEIITIMGASQYTLELIGIKVYKSMRNKYNRINNCETANLTKTVNASVDQINAIKYLERVGKFSILPTEVYNVALLRKNNPEASLNELCGMCEDSISRSGMNHRLQKLVKIANNLKNDN